MATPGKKKNYKNCRFKAEVLRNSVESFSNLLKENHKSDTHYSILSIYKEDVKTSYDDFDEFISDYRFSQSSFNIFIKGAFQYFSVTFSDSPFDFYTSVEFEGSDRKISNKLFDIFDQHAQDSRVEKRVDKKTPIPPKIFIGHGRSDQWKLLKDHLQEKHGKTVIAYETGARAGHTIRDILEDLIKQSSFALIVMTAEDEQIDGKIRCRQNVVHEAGLFQGSLGFSRAVILLEDGVEEFTNLAGIQYIPFSKNNIKESFGEVLATLRREFEQG